MTNSNKLVLQMFDSVFHPLRTNRIGIQRSWSVLWIPRQSMETTKIHENETIFLRAIAEFYLVFFSVDQSG